MAITRPIRSLLVRGLVGALALGGVGCSIYPAAPAEPAYDTDVLPIFQAHCTRCHGNGPDGGSLNVPTETTVPQRRAGAHRRRSAEFLRREDLPDAVRYDRNMRPG